MTENSTLDTWDDSDTKAILKGETDVIYANYTLTNGTTLDNTTSLCKIQIYNGTWSKWYNMTYNETTKLWTYTLYVDSTSYRLANVSCNSSIALYQSKIEELRIVCDYYITVSYLTSKNGTTNIKNWNNDCQVKPELFITWIYNLTNATPKWNETLTTYDGRWYKWNLTNESVSINYTIEILNYTRRREWFWFVE